MVFPPFIALSLQYRFGISLFGWCWPIIWACIDGLSKIYFQNINPFLAIKIKCMVGEVQNRGEGRWIENALLVSKIA